MARKEHSIHDQTDILPTRKLIAVFSALAGALLISWMDQSGIGVALPIIGVDLNSASTITWAGTSLMIANASSQILFGRLSDIVGRKEVLLSSLVLLAIADLLCGFAQTGPQFYGFRGIAGVGNAGIMNLAMTMVSDVTTLEQRGK